MARFLIVKCIVISAILMLGSMACAQAPSFYGYSGLLAIPTADALSQDQYSVGIFALDVQSGADSNTYSAHLGLPNNIEVGFSRVRPLAGGTETWINAKYRFQSETTRVPAVAAGVFDLTGQIDTTTYIVMSRSLTPRARTITRYGEISTPRIHLGVAGGQLNGFFGGISAVLGDRFLLMIEHDSNDFNLGARLAITENVRVQAGFMNGISDLAAGISYTRLR